MADRAARGRTSRAGRRPSRRRTIAIAVAFLPHSPWASRSFQAGRRSSRRMVGAARSAGYRSKEATLTSTPLRAAQQPQRPREAVGFARKRANTLFGVKAVGSFLPGLTRKAFEKYGFSTASLVTDWAAIAGTRARRLHRAGAPEMAAWRRAADDGAASTEKGRPGATLVLQGRRRPRRSTCSTRRPPDHRAHQCLFRLCGRRRAAHRAGAGRQSRPAAAPVAASGGGAADARSRPHRRSRVARRAGSARRRRQGRRADPVLLRDRGDPHANLPYSAPEPMLSAARLPAALAGAEPDCTPQRTRNELP